MRILMFSDLHLSDATKELAERLLRQILQEDVEAVFHLGDLFDQKDRIPNHLQKMIIDFVTVLQWQGKKFFALFGNHDGYLKDFPSACYLDHLPNAKLITEPTLVMKYFYFVPYDTDYEKIKRAIREAPLVARYCCIHADIEGFSRASNVIKRTTLENRFKKIFIGHIHQPTREGKFICIGNPFARNFTETSPYNKPIQRGYIIYDNGVIKFIPFDAPYYVKIDNANEKKIKEFEEAYEGKQVHLWLDFSDDKEYDVDTNKVKILSKIVTRNIPKEEIADDIPVVKLENLKDYLRAYIENQKKKESKRAKERFFKTAKKLLKHFGILI